MYFKCLYIAERGSPFLLLLWEVLMPRVVFIQRVETKFISSPIKSGFWCFSLQLSKLEESRSFSFIINKLIPECEPQEGFCIIETIVLHDSLA